MSIPSTSYMNFLDNQPGAVFHSLLPASTFPSPFTVTGFSLSPSAMAADYPCVVLPAGMPQFYHTVFEKPWPSEYRKFFLDRSVFDLLDAHSCLSLTDPRLLGWYQQLSPGDRKLIQDEGGLYHFLQRHPALELSSRHVYVKYNLGRTPPVQPHMGLIEHASGTLGPKKYRCDSDYIHEEICHAELLPNLEVETRQGKPEVMSNMAVTQQQIANITSAVVHPLQSDLPAVEKEDIVDDDDEVGVIYKELDNLLSIIEEDESILICLDSKDVRVLNSEVHSLPVSTCNEAAAADSETLKSDQSVIKTNTAEKCTSPMPHVPTCDVLVGTEGPETSDKHVNTEVHMADLDYLAEEFIRLRVAEEELRRQQEKMKSVGCKLKKECGCVQRAQQAELCLLALQYNMCRQHCWRLHCTSAEAGQLTSLSENPPANIVGVLQKLESDYNELKDKVLAGLPLEQLQPLSVDPEKIISGTSYIPAQTIADVLGNVPPWSSQEPQKLNVSGNEKESPDIQSKNGSEHKKQIKKNSKARRAVSFAPQDRDCFIAHNSNKQEGKQPSACKDTTSEAWYDAEEDLEPAGPAVAAETGQDQAGSTEAETSESAGEEAKSSALWVSNLPSSVQESDVLQWFQKYQASDVSISAFKNGLRVAVVITSGPQSAEAAVRELNGCSMQGHTLHVEFISKATAEIHSQASASDSDPECWQDAARPQTCKTECSSPERKLISQPPLSSSIKMRKVVSIYPTAKGTCVPQHFGTMESFDILMEELTQRHPDVERQKIVDALIELKAEHRGVLSSLPLKTISEMTSELLSRQMSAEQF